MNTGSNASSEPTWKLSESQQFYIAYYWLSQTEAGKGVTTPKIDFAGKITYGNSSPTSIRLGIVQVVWP